MGHHHHEHDHEYMHEHNIPHTHDHEHHHEHDHEHEHHHEHHCDPAHCHEGCAGCGGNHTPQEELAAIMKYMVGHNTAHANELAGLAKKMKDLGDNMAYEQVMAAVSDFEKGNMRLSAVLAAMNIGK